MKKIIYASLNLFIISAITTIHAQITIDTANNNVLIAQKELITAYENDNITKIDTARNAVSNAKKIYALLTQQTQQVDRKKIIAQKLQQANGDIEVAKAFVSMVNKYGNAPIDELLRHEANDQLRNALTAKDELTAEAAYSK